MNGTQNVLVTLESPYNVDPRTKKEIPLTLRYGTHDARVMSPYLAEAGLPDAGELVDAGAHLDLMPRGLRQLVPGKPDAVDLRTDGEDEASAIVPIEAAILWFGNARIPRTSPPGTEPRNTFANEKARVALFWGGYKRPRLALNGRTSCTKGTNDYDPALIGPPRVPHVRIEKVSASGKVTGTAFRPWEHFDWDADVQYDHPEASGAASAATLPAALAAFSLEDLERFVASQKAAHAKGKVAVTSG